MRHHANSPCRRGCAASCGMSSDSTQHTNAMFRKHHPLPKDNNPQLRLRAENLCIFRTRKDEQLERLEQLSECVLRTISNDSASSYEAWRLALGPWPFANNHTNLKRHKKHTFFWIELHQLGKLAVASDLSVHYRRRYNKWKTE